MLKKILITGGEGQLGKPLCSYLYNKYNILSTSRKIYESNKLYNSFKMDISSKEAVYKTINSFKPDIIINCAAYSNVDYCEKNKKKTHSINVNGLRNIIDTAPKTTFIIHISTDYIFDGINGPYLEEDLAYPINYYGKTKLEAENILRGSHHKSLIIRPNVLYSEDLFSKSNFFAWAYKTLLKNNPMYVVNDQISNPTYIEHLVKCIFQCIIMKYEGILNVGSDDYISRYDFVIYIAEIFNFNKSIIKPITSKELYKINNSYIARRPMNTGLITDKISTELNISSCTTKHHLNTIKNKASFL